ncbi:MAG: amidohydrolase family protein [Candidatus Limnocylindrales bacterium]|nr:amidohydrolase family protein [Candidatus Limnocylindrales bacterium]
MAQRTVDCHNHWYPPDYLAYLVSRTEPPYARQTGPTSYVCYAPGDVIVAHIDRAGHYDLKARIEDLDKAGLDTQIMSITIPGPEMLPVKEGIYWAKRTNDSFARAVQDYPGRFYAYAGLPWQAPDEAVKELERCHKDLGAVGIQAFSNVNGEPLFFDKFDPIWALANELDLPFLVHPTVPLTASVMDMVRIPYQLYGYTLDTSMAVISLIFNGVFQKYPNLKAVHSHLGGMVPYLVQRLRASWKGYAKEWGLELEENPDITYATRVWPDTTSFYLPAMRCALEWVGPGHLVVGTDYAHRVGDPEGAIQAVKDLGASVSLAQDETDMMLGKNAEALFKLPPMPTR